MLGGAISTDKTVSSIQQIAVAAGGGLSRVITLSFIDFIGSQPVGPHNNAVHYYELVVYTYTHGSPRAWGRGVCGWGRGHLHTGNDTTLAKMLMLCMCFRNICISPYNYCFFVVSTKQASKKPHKKYLARAKFSPSIVHMKAKILSALGTGLRSLSPLPRALSLDPTGATVSRPPL